MIALRLIPIIILLFELPFYALPGAITNLKVKIDGKDRDIVIIEDMHFERLIDEDNLNTYLQEWDKVVLRNRHNFIWYFEGAFDTLLGSKIPHPLPVIYKLHCSQSFMRRPFALLKSKLSSAAVDIRVLSQLYYHLDKNNEHYVHNWPNILEQLRAAQQVINQYGSNLAQQHTQAIINLSEQAERLSPETRRGVLESLHELHALHHFDIIALGALLYALANYPQPCILLCGAGHAERLITLLCDQQHATVVQRLSSESAQSYGLGNHVINPQSLADLCPTVHISGMKERLERKSKARVVCCKLPNYVQLDQIEKVLADVAKRNPVKHSPLRSRL